MERIKMATLTRIVKAGLVEAAHDISKGALAVSLAEIAIQGQKGFTVSLDDIPAKTDRIDQLLFSESKPRFILESRQKNTRRIPRRMGTARIPAAKIGLVEGSRGEVAHKSDPMIR